MSETIAHAIKQARTKLAEAGIGSAHLDAELLLAFVVNHDRPWILAHDTDELSPAHRHSYDVLINRRLNREPLVHLTGTREFYDLDIKITSDVLTPRVETEQMVDWAIKYAPKNSNLIDIGTGSGAIALGGNRQQRLRPYGLTRLDPLADFCSNLGLGEGDEEASRRHTNCKAFDLWI